ncbi:MAG: cobyrinic acid a,c-diamide synthase [Gammaproteobacteria bacterium]|nr:MAG: cobyrinic acid a,c-diamide synthase [Gammaproteobacteria bacterium]
MNSFYISAASKSSGKTIISIALSRMLSQNYKVQTFKKGPDYIDAAWLGISSDKPCYNLDSYITDDKQSKQCFMMHSQKSQISIVEGNKGLYDGLDLHGSNCNAAMAKLLNLPVILVINTQGTIRGVAPLLLGYQNFDKDCNIAGVIFNKTAGERHLKKLTSVVETYTNIPILGCVYRDDRLSLDERHLGLINSAEIQADKKIQIIADIIKPQLDLDKILQLTAHKKPTKIIIKPVNKKYHNLTLGIFKDEAFNFYYSHDLDTIRNVGVKIIKINSLQDKKIPDVDGLFIGGGFPEKRLEQLSNNKNLLTDLKNKIESGLPCYAECGGLMYLSNSITYKNKTKNMARIIDANCKMSSAPIGRGYIQIKPNRNHLWTFNENIAINAHEFHYSSIQNINPKYKFAYEVKRGTGLGNGFDGIIYKNLIANYAHLQHNDNNPYLDNFLNFIQHIKKQKNT